MRFPSCLFLVLTAFSVNSFAADCNDPSAIENAAMDAWTVQNPGGQVSVAGGVGHASDAFNYDGKDENGNDEWTVHLQDQNPGQCFYGYLVRTNPDNCQVIVGSPQRLDVSPNCS